MKGEGRRQEEEEEKNRRTIRRREDKEKGTNTGKIKKHESGGEI